MSCDGLITIYHTVILMSQVHAVVTKVFNRQFIGFWMDGDITVRNMYMYTGSLKVEGAWANTIVSVSFRGGGGSPGISHPPPLKY